LVTGVGLLQLFQYAGLREYIGFTALLVGHVVICLPFAVRTVAISLHTLPANVTLAAASLGASRWRTLWHVVCPLAKSGIIAGAVGGIAPEVREGEFVTLLGPSGCGKTTTLGLVAGFFPPSAGEIYLKGRPVAGLPPFRRDIGVVFQDYALFPHLSAGDNVAF